MDQNIDQSATQQPIDSIQGQEPTTHQTVMQLELHNREAQSSKPFWKIVLMFLVIVFFVSIVGGFYFLETEKNNTNINPKQVNTSPTIQTTIGISPTIMLQQSIDKDFWRTDTSSFSAQELFTLKNTLLQKGEPQGGKLVVIFVERQGDFGDVSIETILSSTNQPLQTDGTAIYFHKNIDGAWTLLYPSDPNFCNQLKQFPHTMYDGAAQYYFCK